jgi:hypothetical protein
VDDASPKEFPSGRGKMMPPSNFVHTIFRLHCYTLKQRKIVFPSLRKNRKIFNGRISARLAIR